jgi:hypothetical protein
MVSVPTIACAQFEPEWSGTGKIRLIVEVPPVDLKDRKADTLIASFPVDFDKILAERRVGGSVDLSTLQVHQLDALGKPLPFPKFDGSRSDYDRPARFDDDSLPEKFPASVVRAALTRDGRSDVVIRNRKARLFNREVLPKTGKIVWTHSQTGNQPTKYAIYFDVLPTPSSEAWQVSPAPWIGDADVLRRSTGQSLGGWSHFTATAGDFNGDGLFDIVAGTEKGNLMWFPNHGKPGEAKFIGCRVLTDEHGPLDTGWYGAPFLFDWDNDGLTDLIVGTSGNVILWWKNVGTKTEPKLSFQSFVKAGDKRLEVPEAPVAEDYGKKTFLRDYYNQPWVGDFTGDGIPDIVTGGYTTGMIWLFRGIGRHEKGVPKLDYVGPVEADGQPIDTTWAAAPSVADFDGDGRLDLVTGSWWWSGIPHEPALGQIEYLMYYKGGGDSKKPTLARAPLPRDGELPNGAIARPSLVDWNNDGLIDLMVSMSSEVCVYLNVGSAKEPKWKMSEQCLTIPWGFTEGVDVVAESADVSGDGQPEFLTGQTFFSVGGSPHSPNIVSLGHPSVNGKPINHPGPGYGDPYYHTSLRDWDVDGKADLLWGTQQGNVFLHRAVGTKEKPFEFAEGVMLKTLDGQPVKVGPPVVASREEATDFTILQGSRIRMLSDDFDGDKIDDLIVTETYGNVWLYRNTKQGGTDTLEPPVLLQKLSSRTSLVVVDWNLDGKPDLFAQGTAAEPGAIMINETKDGKPALSKPSRPFELPYLFWGTQFGATDWNRDGDRDLMITAEFFSFFVEQSFLTHGYRQATLLSAGVKR